jgi:hypothetical protein
MSKSIEAFIEALQIFSKYMAKELQTEYFCSAEHDIIYIHSELPKSGSTDGHRLKELGFHWDRSINGWAYYV